VIITNFAPMGIDWGEDELTVRPFRQSRTCHNLIATGYGVANLTDDVLAFVQSGLYDAALPHFPASAVPGAGLRFPSPASRSQKPSQSQSQKSMSCAAVSPAAAARSVPIHAPRAGTIGAKSDSRMWTCQGGGLRRR